jgi:hypothetical protein
MLKRKGELVLIPKDYILIFALKSRGMVSARSVKGHVIGVGKLQIGGGLQGNA